MSKHPLWKKTEEVVAARLGGKRVPINGRKGADVAHPLFALEVKERRRPMPLEIRAAVAQAVGGASSGQLPVVVFHHAGDRHDEDLVVMRLSDFEDLHGLLSQVGSRKEEAVTS